MKVIGAGLPRTATTTQMLALDILGFGPCYHMRNLMADLDQTALWHRAVHGEGEPIWDQVFDGFASTTDWPSAFFYRELIDVYPDAKVILSVRDAGSWERSMRDTVWAIYHSDNLLHHMSRARYLVDPQWRAWVDLMTEMMWVGPHAPFTGSYSDREQLIAGYHRWNQEVQATVPAERLIVWDPAEGWEPLCEFLEVDVPSEPLPEVNDTQGFKDMIVSGTLGALQDWWDRERAPASA
jgi:hypothetical protein